MYKDKHASMSTPPVKETLIQASSRSPSLDLRELLSYSELWVALIKRDIQIRYKQTVLGFGWALLQPLVTMLIFTLIFGRLAKIPSDGMPYSIFVLSGLLTWSLFSTSVTSAGSSLLGAANLISKVYFPRLIVPLSSMGVAVVDFLIACLLLLAMMLYYEVVPSWQIVLLPFFILGLISCAVGVGAWLASVTVSYRDFRFFVPFTLQIWMYLTPVVYPVSFLPERWSWLTYLNPVNGWVLGVRAAFLGGPIDWLAILISCIWSAIILVVGLRYFARVERWFADVI